MTHALHDQTMEPEISSMVWVLRLVVIMRVSVIHTFCLLKVPWGFPLSMIF